MAMQVIGKYARSGRETTFTSIGLSKEGANRYMFMFRDKNTGTEREMSVAQYFVQVLGIQLEFPALQCVLVRPLSLFLALRTSCCWLLGMPPTWQSESPTVILSSEPFECVSGDPVCTAEPTDSH